MSNLVSASSVTGFEQALADVEWAGHIDDVIAALGRAKHDRVALYPVSTGLNWGYGSATPPRPGCRVLDLSRMKRILNEEAISEANPVAVIEPGVTQGQLYETLQRRCPGLTFNVTGSSRDTSIIGNALDRGVGYLGPRREDLFGLEVVTGAGQVLRTGFRRLGEGSPLAHSHPYGLGPMLDGLFFQGNSGIITSACFRLIPRAPCTVAVSLALKPEADLGRMIDALARLKREGVMGSVTHIGNKARTHASMMHGITDYLATHCGLAGEALPAAAARALAAVAPHEWASLGGVYGTRAQVRAAVAEIRGRMKDMARVTVLSERILDLGYGVMHGLRHLLPLARANAAAIAAIRPLHGLALGIPTDVAIDNLLWRYGRSDLKAKQLDASPCGLLFINPALPMDGAFVVDVVRGMIAVAAEHSHELYLTLNIETATSMVAVANLLFDRGRPDEVARAHRCADALLAYIRSRQLEVYRARADMMGEVVDASSPYWQTVHQLKKVLDPDGLIAPGRYNLA